MAQTRDPVTQGLATLLDPVVACFTREVAQRVVNLRAAPEVQARVDLLAERCNEGLLTAEETAEYDASIRAMEVLAVLQQQAHALRGRAHPGVAGKREAGSGHAQARPRGPAAGSQCRPPWNGAPCGSLPSVPCGPSGTSRRIGTRKGR